MAVSRSASAPNAALKKSGLPLRGRLIVQSVVGEEDGGIGTFAMADRGYRADAAYVLEPTRLRLIPAQAGALSFRLRISGDRRMPRFATRASAPSRSSKSSRRGSGSWSRR